MEKAESKTIMTVVHTAYGANKPAAPSTNSQLPKKALDPSSCFRTERYPIPTSFEYRFDPLDREYA